MTMTMNKEYHKQWRKQRQESGLCRSCNETIWHEGSTVYCESCLKKYRESNRKNAHKYVEARKNYRFDKSKIRYSSVKFRSKRDGIDFAIEQDEFCEWFKSQSCCHYCSIKESELIQLGRKKSMLTVDRKDSSKGYSMDNLCVACFRCNNMKSNFFTEQEWLEIAQKFILPRIHEYHLSGTK